MRNSKLIKKGIGIIMVVSFLVGTLVFSACNKKPEGNITVITNAVTEITVNSQKQVAQ